MQRSPRFTIRDLKGIIGYGDNARRIIEGTSVTASVFRRVASEDADAERHVSDGTVQAAQGEETDPKYTVTVIHYRTRLADHGNLNAKYAIDALVAGGVLPDDRPEYVEERHVQKKVRNKRDERTEITIEERI